MSSSMLRSLKLASSILQKQSLRGTAGGSASHNFIAPATLQLQLRPISTSKKNRDVTVTAGGDKKDEKPDPADFSIEAAKKKWISYGFHWETEEQDLTVRNFTMFTTVTCLIVLFTFVVSYFPDSKRRHWFQREAYIELARREALGLPLIDEDLVPVTSINLPTEEELGNFEIVV